jgi:hypothetical protein
LSREAEQIASRLIGRAEGDLIAVGQGVFHDSHAIDEDTALTVGVGDRDLAFVIEKHGGVHGRDRTARNHQVAALVRTDREVIQDLVDGENRPCLGSAHHDDRWVAHARLSWRLLNGLM